MGTVWGLIPTGRALPQAAIECNSTVSTETLAAQVKMTWQMEDLDLLLNKSDKPIIMDKNVYLTNEKKFDHYKYYEKLLHRMCSFCFMPIYQAHHYSLLLSALIHLALWVDTKIPDEDKKISILEQT